MDLTEAIGNELAVKPKDGLWPNLQAYPIVLNRYAEALQRVYALITLPNFLITFDKDSNKLSLTTEEEKVIPLGIDQKTQQIILFLLEKKRIKIGNIGPFDIYFDHTSDSKIVIDTRLPKVMGDPIQLNVHLYPKVLEAITWLESLGHLQTKEPLIVHRQTKAITIFLQDGSEVVVNPGEKFHETLLALANNQFIELGAEFSDRVFFSLNTRNFHRTSDGSVVEMSDFTTGEIVDVDERMLKVIRYISQFKTAKLIDNDTEQPLILLKNNSHDCIFIDSQHPDYFDMLRIFNKRPVQIGLMTGNSVVLFNLQSGFMIRSRNQIDYSNYQLARKMFPHLEMISNQMKMFLDKQDLNLLHIVHPGGKTETLKNNHVLFPFLSKLLKGMTAYFIEEKADQMIYHAISYTETGITSRVVERKELNQLLLDQRAFKLDLHPQTQKISRPEEKKEKRKTKNPSPQKYQRGKMRPINH